MTPFTTCESCSASAVPRGAIPLDTYQSLKTYNLTKLNIIIISKLKDDKVIYCNTKEVSTQNVTSLSTHPGKHYSLVLHTYQFANQS